MVILIILGSIFYGCRKGGGSGSESGQLSQNACEDLGLGTKSYQKIVNGTPCTNLERSPVVRLVFINLGGQTSFCSGTMITNNDVLTAAHCFLLNPVRVLMLTGKSLEASTSYEAGSWSVHPNLSAVGNSVKNDVAIVHLTEIPNLPTVPVLISQSVDKGEEVSIFGYGTDENGNFDFEDLQSGEMLVSDVTSTNVSAVFNDEGSNTCQGDSGGPMLARRSGIVAIAGITSSGTVVNCLEGDTSFFTNLNDKSVHDFLQKEVPDASYL